MTVRIDWNLESSQRIWAQDLGEKGDKDKRILFELWGENVNLSISGSVEDFRSLTTALVRVLVKAGHDKVILGGTVLGSVEGQQPWKVS